jgi:hypothetical protein
LVESEELLAGNDGIEALLCELLEFVGPELAVFCGFPPCVTLDDYD